MRIVKDFKSNDSLSANPKRVTGAFLVSADCKGLRCVDAVEPLALKLFHLAQSSWQALHHIIPRWSRKPRGRNPTGSVRPSPSAVVACSTQCHLHVIPVRNPLSFVNASGGFVHARRSGYPIASALLTRPSPAVTPMRFACDGPSKQTAWITRVLPPLQSRSD